VGGKTKDEYMLQSDIWEHSKNDTGKVEVLDA
jgi:hypothetical protein